MNIENIFDTYKVCEETQRMKNALHLNKRQSPVNKDIAIQMLKDKQKGCVIEKITGISKGTISKYKKKLGL